MLKVGNEGKQISIKDEFISWLVQPEVKQEIGEIKSKFKAHDTNLNAIDIKKRHVHTTNPFRLLLRLFISKDKLNSWKDERVRNYPIKLLFRYVGKNKDPDNLDYDKITKLLKIVSAQYEGDKVLPLFKIAFSSKEEADKKEAIKFIKACLEDLQKLPNFYSFNYNMNAYIKAYNKAKELIDQELSAQIINGMTIKLPSNLTIIPNNLEKLLLKLKEKSVHFSINLAQSSVQKLPDYLLNHADNISTMNIPLNLKNDPVVKKLQENNQSKVIVLE